MRCEQLTEDLSALADGSASLSVAERRHVEQCLRCQAEVAQYRKLLRALRSLRGDVVQPNPSLVDEIIAALEEMGDGVNVRSLVQGRRLVYLGGLAAATAAGAAGYVFANRGKRPLAAG